MSSIKAAATFPQVARGRRPNPAASAPVVGFRRAETMFAASLSIGAAAIHLVAASSHVGPLGDLALGFYWAALFQAAFAVAVLTHPSSRRLARIGVGINLAFIGVWAWSRTIGLPMIPGGPEPVSMADATTVAFQIVLVWLLAVRPGVLGSGPVHGRRPAASLGPVPSSAFVVGIGLVLLSTTIAMADGATGHGHDRGAAHAHPENEPGLTEPGVVEAPHGHGGATVP